MALAVLNSVKVLDPVFRFLIQFLFLTLQHVIKPSPHRQNCCQKMVHLLLLHFWIPRSMSCNAPSHSLGKKTKESAWISMTLVYRVRLLLEFRQNMKVGFIQYTGDPRLLQTHYCNFSKFSVKGLSIKDVRFFLTFLIPPSPMLEFWPWLT